MFKEVGKKIEGKIVWLGSSYTDDDNKKHTDVWIGKEQKYWGEKIILKNGKTKWIKASK